MPSIAESDLARMRDALLFDGPERGRKLSRYWTLLALAAVIASAGIVGDSTATVIGAMIVAPLMTPILGTVLAVVTGDLPNVARSVGLVVAGAALVVLLAWALGHLVAVPVTADTSSQVAGRIHPRVIDLVAAVATGAVGAFALVRSDVSDTLPGVAIAISLVPPLAVVGLTLEAGRPHEANGALLLFLTNAFAILLTGLVVMALYRVTAVAHATGRAARVNRVAAALVTVAAVVALAAPLTVNSARLTSEERSRARVADVARSWADERGLHVTAVDAVGDVVTVRVEGTAAAGDLARLRRALAAAGVDDLTVHLDLVPVRRITFGGG